MVVDLIALPESDEVVFGKTPKGQDLYAIFKYLELFDKTPAGKKQDAIGHSITILNHAFKEKWKGGGLELIQKVFGTGGDAK